MSSALVTANPLPNAAAARGRVLFGTCGWSDDSILRCGRFYPAWVKSPEQRLEFYGTRFPCVEVDSSTYAIPRPNVTASWASRVPPGFTFHFKAFGLFCHRQCPFSALPAEVKQQLLQRSGTCRASNGGSTSSGGSGGDNVTLEQLGPEGEAAVWEAFHRCLEPVVKTGRMGCVVFQFQLKFRPSPENRAYVEHCRRRLDARLPMAVEFRNRSWFADAAAAADTAAWLSSLQPLGGAALIAADELRHETYVSRSVPYGGGRAAGGPTPPHEVLPIALQVCDPRFAYVRLHRREGTRERLLQQAEAQAWAERLALLAPQLSGPAYFLIGTDWEDAPVVNAGLLTAALPPQQRLDWRAQLAAAAAGRRGTIHSLFSAASATAGAASDAAGSSMRNPAAAAANELLAPAAMLGSTEGAAEGEAGEGQGASTAQAAGAAESRGLDEGAVGKTRGAREELCGRADRSGVSKCSEAPWAAVRRGGGAPGGGGGGGSSSARKAPVARDGVKAGSGKGAWAAKPAAPQRSGKKAAAAQAAGAKRTLRDFFGSAARMPPPQGQAPTLRGYAALPPLLGDGAAGGSGSSAHAVSQAVVVDLTGPSEGSCPLVAVPDVAAAAGGANAGRNDLGLGQDAHVAGKRAREAN